MICWCFSDDIVVGINISLDIDVYVYVDDNVDLHFVVCACFDVDVEVCSLFLNWSFDYQARAESAKAFTGRRNSHSGRGEDFLTGQPNFFTETAITPERKVEKLLPRWEINRRDEG